MWWVWDVWVRDVVGAGRIGCGMTVYEAAQGRNGRNTESQLSRKAVGRVAGPWGSTW
mgnify:CR=1 FL=1